MLNCLTRVQNCCRLLYLNSYDCIVTIYCSLDDKIITSIKLDKGTSI